MIYENDNYLVRENTETQEYEVVSKINGFIEARVLIRVEALRLAKIFDFSLKSWEEQLEALDSDAEFYIDDDIEGFSIN